MPAHIGWGSIELLHNVVRTLNFLNERDGAPLPSVRYRAKVKVHGTNCAVQVRSEGVYAQSRTEMLTLPSGDRKGFARWVADHTDYWKAIQPGTTVFGEWCGPGVEKGMAISKLGRKVFAVFAIQTGYGENAHIEYDPDQIAEMLPVDHPDVFIVPWLPFTFRVDYSDKEQMARAVGTINRAVHEIEQEDPWVQATFGISGLGEGLVAYPVEDHKVSTAEAMALLMFKAKGEKHRTAGARKAAQVNPEVVASVGEFVTLMVTEARLNQGVAEACGGELEMRHTGKFLQWVAADVQKESVAELEAAGLTWKQVLKAVQTRAREWYKAEVVG
jgi:hypothetical protein